MMSDFSDLEKPILGVPRMRRGQRTKYVPNHRSFGAFAQGLEELAHQCALARSRRSGDQQGDRLAARAQSLRELLPTNHIGVEKRRSTCPLRAVRAMTAFHCGEKAVMRLR